MYLTPRGGGVDVVMGVHVVKDGWRDHELTTYLSWWWQMMRTMVVVSSTRTVFVFVAAILNYEQGCGARMVAVMIWPRFPWSKMFFVLDMTSHAMLACEWWAGIWRQASVASASFPFFLFLFLLSKDLLAGFADGKKRRSAKKSESREQADRLAISRYGALSLSRVPLASPTLLLSFFVQSQDQDQDTYRNDAEYKLLHSLRASDVNLQLQHNCQSFVYVFSNSSSSKAFGRVYPSKQQKLCNIQYFMLIQSPSLSLSLSCRTSLSILLLSILWLLLCHTSGVKTPLFISIKWIKCSHGTWGFIT